MTTLRGTATGTRIPTVQQAKRTDGRRYIDQFFTGLEALEDRLMMAATPAPIAPYYLTSKALGTSAVQLTWKTKDTSAKGFYVLRSSGDQFSQIATITKSYITTFTDTTVLPSQSYRYEIVAYNAAGTSKTSPIASVNIPLLAPSGVSASFSSGKISLSWTGNDATATGYNILRSMDGSNSYYQVATITSGDTTSYSDTTLSTGHLYSYKIQAYDNAAFSSESTAASAAVPLVAPSTFSAVISGSLISLNWSGVDSASTGYYLYRSTDGVNYTKIQKIALKKTMTYLDTSVLSSQKYYYAVQSYNALTTSALSAVTTVTTPMAAPANVTAVLSGTSATLSWQTLDASTTGFRIYRSVDGAAASLLTTIVSGSTTSFTNSGLGTGHSYTYQIQAYNSTSLSSMSTAASVVVPLLTPSNVSAAQSGTSIRITWTGNDAGATGYYVLRSTNGKSFSVLATVKGVSSATYLDRTATSGLAYSYKVQAYNATATSLPSAVAAVPPAAPTSLTANASTTSISLKWSNSDKTATAFIVMRSTDGSTYTEIGRTANARTTSYTDSAVSSRQLYYYKILSTNGRATSAASNVAQAALASNGGSDNTSNVTFSTRYGNELVISGTSASDVLRVDQNGSALLITAGGQTFTYSLPAAGVFIYTRGGTDTITITQSLAVRTTIMSIDGGSTTIVSAGSNVSAWIDSTDSFSGTGAQHSVAAFAGGVSKDYGASLADPTDSGTTKKINLSLWGTGPVADDVRQGAVGDCYYLAAIAAMANTSPARLLETAVDMGDGTYTVEFFNYANNNQRVYVRIDNDFSVGGFSGGLKFANLGPNNVMWTMVLEKAWAYYRTGANTYASTSAGWMGSVFTVFNVRSTEFHTANYSESAFYSMVSSALSSGKPVTLASYSGPYLVNGHAYTIISASKDSSGVTRYVVRNPWGSSGTYMENSQGYATLTFAQMLVNGTDGSIAV
jgi:fibronectin type 3 domain-containing protein